MIGGWVVVAARAHPTQGPYENLESYGPFKSKTKAEEWLNETPLTWRLSKVCRIVQVKDKVDA